MSNRNTRDMWTDRAIALARADEVLSDEFRVHGKNDEINLARVFESHIESTGNPGTDRQFHS